MTTHVLPYVICSISFPPSAETVKRKVLLSAII